MLITGPVHQKGAITINIYAPNIRVLKCIRQMLTELKEETESNTIITGDAHTLLSVTGTWNTRKTRKGKEGLEQH